MADELAELIEERLHEALVLSRNANLDLPDGTWCGLAEAAHGGAVIRLSMKDVGRIAAAVARGWF